MKQLIGTVRDAWAGRPCAIIANGPSVLEHDLTLLSMPTLGLNRRVVPTTFHLVADRAHLDRDYDGLHRLAAQGTLFVLGDHWPFGVKIAIADGTPWFPWSDDLELGVVTSLGSTGTVVYPALQLACWLGSRDIYLIGVDLTGDTKFDGSPASPPDVHSRMDSLLCHAVAPMVSLGARAYVVGEQSRCRAFPKVPFRVALKACR
jgi:hypothetical protein